RHLLIGGYVLRGVGRYRACGEVGPGSAPGAWMGNRRNALRATTCEWPAIAAGRRALIEALGFRIFRCTPAHPRGVRQPTGTMATSTSTKTLLTLVVPAALAFAAAGIALLAVP